MNFDEMIKIAGKMYIDEEVERLEEEIARNSEEIKIPLKFRIRMWWMFRKAILKDMFQSLKFKFKS
jgi:hypothetical protein